MNKTFNRKGAKHAKKVNVKRFKRFASDFLRVLCAFAVMNLLLKIDM